MSATVAKPAKQYVSVTFKEAPPAVVLLLYDTRSDAMNDVYDNFEAVFKPVRTLFPSQTIKTITAIRSVKGVVPELDFCLGEAARRAHLDNV
jgi:hypothetical protein